MKIMIDTNAYDSIVENEEFRLLISKLYEEEKVELLTTHIQKDEIEKIPNHKKRQSLGIISVSASEVPTHGVIVGTSRVDRCTFADPTELLKFANYKGGKIKNPQDVLISVTAEKLKVDVLVTNDKNMANKYKANTGYKVMTAKELYFFLRQQF